jgi:hypothetical protein
MKNLDQILAQFTAALLPHEQFFIAQGLATARWHREENLPEYLTPCAYLDEATQNRRASAHRELELHLKKWRRAGGGPPPAFLREALLAWAVAEMKLNTMSSFGAFALLLRAVAGDAALPLAAALYADAARHPLVLRPQALEGPACSQMALLAAALDQPACHATPLSPNCNTLTSSQPHPSTSAHYGGFATNSPRLSLIGRA